MTRSGVRRLVCISALGVGDSHGHGGFIFDRLFQPLLLRHAYKDKDRQEAAIRASSLDWVIVRPAMLTNDSSVTIAHVPLPDVPDTPPEVPGYKIVDELGRGGMGVVYRARQVGVGRLVALKMILSGGHASPADRERFRREAEVIGRLEHPGVVRIYEVGEHAGLLFFSMELCDSGSLAECLDAVG